MYKEFDVLRNTTFEKVDAPTNTYIVEVSCDANDGDYINGSTAIEEDIFENNELLMLVLAFICKYQGKFHEEWNGSYYGHHVAENKALPWLKEYLVDNYLLLYAGMCDDYCHSISSVCIDYYDDDGVCYSCELPDIDELFETKEQLELYLTNLYERTESRE